MVTKVMVGSDSHEADIKHAAAKNDSRQRGVQFEGTALRDTHRI